MERGAEEFVALPAHQRLKEAQGNSGTGGKIPNGRRPPCSWAVTKGTPFPHKANPPMMVGLNVGEFCWLRLVLFGPVTEWGMRTMPRITPLTRFPRWR